MGSKLLRPISLSLFPSSQSYVGYSYYVDHANSAQLEGDSHMLEEYVRLPLGQSQANLRER
jgi:hypothetical protein